MVNKTNPKIDKDTPVTWGLLSDATDTLLEGMQKMFDEQSKKISQRLDKLDSKVYDLRFDTTSKKDFIAVSRKPRA